MPDAPARPQRRVDQLLAVDSVTVVWDLLALVTAETPLCPTLAVE